MKAGIAARADSASPYPSQPIATAPTKPRRRYRALGIGVGMAVLAAAAAGGAYWRTQQAKAVDYTTARLDRGAIVRTITASGTVNPILTVIVGSYVSGVIQNITCDYNTPVRRGQVCATIDPRPYQMARDQAQAELGTARAQLLKDQAALEYAEATYQRKAKLERQGWYAHDAADSLKSIRDAASAQIAVDRAGITQRQAALSAAEVNLGYTRIASPVDGVVVSRNVTQGQTVAASFQTPTLFLIAQDLTKMQVDTSVSESDIEGESRSIRVGDPATFTVEAFPNRPFQGRVTQIRQAPQTVQNVVTYDVVVAVDNTDMRLKPGMTATVRIVTDQRNNVLRAPNAALRYRPGGISNINQSGQPPALHRDRLWVMRDGKPSSVPVRAGLADENFTEIATGDVRPGDQIVTGETGGHRAGRDTPVPRF